jgi:YHS domain-containing protein
VGAITAFPAADTGIAWKGIHARRARLKPVEIFAAIRRSESTQDHLPLDPVCRMAVDPDRAAGQLHHEGTAYFLCSLSCAGEFARDPERFVASAGGSKARTVAS